VSERAAAAEVRRAVRAALAELPPGSAPLVVACSGGADSTALAAAAVAVAGREVVGAVVDHGLQDGSRQRAEETVELLAGLGIAAAVHPVVVDGPGGPEAAARQARYAALRAARPHPDSPVLLGHTRDDQAETVLLGLGRGSGARSLAGMRRWDPPWLRPLLAVPRASTRAACAELGLPVWDDPHNTDPRFTRVRLRREVLPLLEDVLAGGVAAALARTADQLREDGDALDAIAEATLRELQSGGSPQRARPPADPRSPADLRPPAEPRPPADPRLPADPRPPTDTRAPVDATAGPPDTRATDTLPLAPLVDLHPAVRRRVLRAWLVRQGVTGLTATHLAAADVLAGRGPDRGGVAVPGGLELVRARGTLSLQTADWSADRSPAHPREDPRRVRR
jgi:tRNA(Ile)-lysidine synthase